MSTRNAKPSIRTFEIAIPENDDSQTRFAYVLMFQKHAWRAAFEAAFHTQLEHKDATIFFTCHNDDERHVRNGFNLLAKEFADKRHITPETIGDIAAKVYMRNGAAVINDNIATPRAAFGAASNSKPRRGSGRDQKQPYQPQQPQEYTPPYKFVAKNDGQKDLMDKINNNDVTFGIGPAGTGKTHVAVARAVEALNNDEIKKILLARPAIGTGKDLGALPGGIEDKLAPYMRPLYDELNKVLGNEQLKKLMEMDVIEIVPVEMMRGRTFTDAYVIVDEAQNCTQEQMRMALTRIGEGSKMVVTGDISQIDLKPKSESGLPWALEKLEGVEGIGIQRFSSQEVVRHRVVQRIVDHLDDKTAHHAPKAAPTESPVTPAAPTADAPPPATQAALPKPHPTRRRPRPQIPE